MSNRAALETWHRELSGLLAAVADAMRTLGIATSSGGISDSVQEAASDRAEQLLAQIAARVQRVNALAARVGEEPLHVPGSKPSVDLRPWWSRLLESVSSTARRQSVGESLETLRLEANAALERAAQQLATGNVS